MEATTKVEVSQFVTELDNGNLAIGNNDHRFMVNKYNVQRFLDCALFKKQEHNLLERWDQEEHEQRVAFLLARFIYNKHYNIQQEDYIIIGGDVLENGSL